jgi:hypothetical protein
MNVMVKIKMSKFCFGGIKTPLYFRYTCSILLCLRTLQKGVCCCFVRKEAFVTKNK